MTPSSPRFAPGDDVMVHFNPVVAQEGYMPRVPTATPARVLAHRPGVCGIEYYVEALNVPSLPKPFWVDDVFVGRQPT